MSGARVAVTATASAIALACWIAAGSAVLEHEAAFAEHERVVARGVESDS